ncbi:GNAT family N-acetyltransferase, partial [Bacillus thuringiensis]
EFQIMIDPHYQGNGYARETTCLAMHYAFSVLNLHKLYLVVNTTNEKAIHIWVSLPIPRKGGMIQNIPFMQKVGFPVRKTLQRKS